MIINYNAVPYIQKINNDVLVSINPISDELSTVLSTSLYRDHMMFMIQIENAYAIDSTFIHQIPKDILDKILNKEVVLCILGSAEAFYGKYLYIDYIYNHLISETNIPESQILFIGGSLDLKEYVLNLSKEKNKSPIKLEYYASYIMYIRKYYDNLYCSNSNVFKPITKKTSTKKYLMLSSVCRPHRVSILSLLNSRKLLNDGYVSFLACKEEWDLVHNECIETYKEISNELIKGNDIKESIPLVLDQKDAKKVYFSWNILKYFNQSYFSVIAETLYDSECPRFLTEKTFKSILYKHPFIVVSRHNSLAMLRFLGFKTFDGIIDERYDLEVNDSKRLLMIVDEVERLCQLSKNDFESFKEQSLEIVEYNFKHLLTTDKLLHKLL